LSEPSLSLQYFDYRAGVGDYLGYGRGNEGGNTDPAWTSSQLKAVNTAVAAGQRQFYNPPVLEGERSSHRWSFLKPVAALALADGEQVISMPADFGGFEGPITVTVSGSNVVGPVDLVSEGAIRSQYAANDDTTGQPQAAALRPIKGVGVNESNRWELNVWPIADDDYTLSFPYYILPDAISGAKPYSYGGQTHVETVMASCLAAAEFYRDNAMGVCHARWMERLAASVSIDRDMQPQYMGYNGDCSAAGLQRRLFRNYWVPATLNSSTWS
jgi:hypothetical protein